MSTDQEFVSLHYYRQAGIAFHSNSLHNFRLYPDSLLLISPFSGCSTTRTKENIQVEEPDLRLELESPVRTLRLGQTAKLSLSITGPGVAKITEGTDGIMTKPLGASFVYSFQLAPQRTGAFTIGPYDLSINERRITSNTVSINVIPQWDGRYGTFFRVDNESIVLGEEIELVAETWARTSPSISLALDRSDLFTSRMGTSNFSSHGEGGGGRVYYRGNSWFIMPKAPGPFKINEQILREFPEDIEAPDITVFVKQPRQQRNREAARR